MLALLSFLYCSLYQTVIYFAGRSGDRIAWYVFHYLLIMISAYVYMIVMFQFIRTKRKDSSDLKMKQYLIPIFGVQTILFILLAGSSFSIFSVYDDGYEAGKCCDDSYYADSNDVLYSCTGIRMFCDL